MQSKLYVITFSKVPEALGAFYSYNIPDEEREILYSDEEGCQCIRYADTYELYQETSEVYSYSMVLYEMFSGKAPFDKMNEDEVIELFNFNLRILTNVN